MGDANPIRTHGDYSKPSDEGYMNTIELPEGKNVVPLRSDTIRIYLYMAGSYYSLLMHGLVLRTYFKKSIIMASTFGSKSKSFMTMSIPPQDEPLINRPVARGTLLMALPDDHQLKFNIHKDAKSLREAIKKRLQKLISQLEILGESLFQEDINLKFLRSLPTEWRTHTLIWRNKTVLEDQSLDDLFNNLKIYEAEVKSSSSTSLTTQNITFVSSQNTNNTNESVSVVTSVFAANTKVPIFALPSVDNLSDAVIYSFFASQSNSPQLDNDDLKQIDADDLEEMDLKWQMAMLNMRAMRMLQLPQERAFCKKVRSPRDTRNKDTQRRNVPVETSTSNALVLQCDGVGSYDWSFQADEEPTNYALVAFTFSSSLSPDNKVAPCSKACSKAYTTLQSHYDKLTNDLKKSQFDVLSYKTGLESIEARLVVYQHNENVFEANIKLLKLDVMLRDNALAELTKKFKKAEQERDELKLKLENFQTSSKNLSKLLASQVTDKTGLGYDNQVFNSTVFDCDELISSESDPDLVFYDAPTAHETVLTVLNVESCSTKPNKDLSQSNRPSAPIIKDWVSESKDESKGKPIPTQKAPSFVQTSEHVKTPRTSVKLVSILSQLKTLGKTFPSLEVPRHSWSRKTCFVCNSLTHLIKECDYHEKKIVHKSVRNHA
uniref:Uncharacterized protein n=1 Tax=Tanacetum cinerariifolium TaxID=118510 RepID=A0A699H2Z9_TANCI|nr:hypothetical protein [Tanacetum cinerariifolium]